MPLLHNPTSVAEILPGANIHEVLAHRLQPARFPGRHNAKKFLVEGYPDALVRLNADGEPFEYTMETAKTFNQLPLYDLETLPYLPVEHDGQTYVITQKVKGSTLADELTKRPTPELAAAIDERWARLARYFMGSKLFDLPAANDIDLIRQHMYGSVSTDRTDKIRLVDLGEYAATYSEHFPEDCSYEDSLLNAASVIVATEYRTSRQLSKARQAVLDALSIAEIVTPEQRLVANAVEESLEQNIRLKYDETTGITVAPIEGID